MATPDDEIRGSRTERGLDEESPAEQGPEEEHVVDLLTQDSEDTSASGQPEPSNWENAGIVFLESTENSQQQSDVAEGTGADDTSANEVVASDRSPGDKAQETGARAPSVDTVKTAPTSVRHDGVAEESVAATISTRSRAPDDLPDAVREHEAKASRLDRLGVIGVWVGSIGSWAQAGVALLVAAGLVGIFVPKRCSPAGSTSTVAENATIREGLPEDPVSADPGPTTPERTVPSSQPQAIHSEVRPDTPGSNVMTLTLKLEPKLSAYVYPILVQDWAEISPRWYSGRALGLIGLNSDGRGYLFSLTPVAKADLTVDVTSMTSEEAQQWFAESFLGEQKELLIVAELDAHTDLDDLYANLRKKVMRTATHAWRSARGCAQMQRAFSQLDTLQQFAQSKSDQKLSALRSQYSVQMSNKCYLESQ